VRRGPGFGPRAEIARIGPRTGERGQPLDADRVPPSVGEEQAEGRIVGRRLDDGEVSRPVEGVGPALARRPVGRSAAMVAQPSRVQVGTPAVGSGDGDAPLRNLDSRHPHRCPRIGPQRR
jgi:hypothetical protein